MALVVEDGSGKSDAESYLSVTDADTYWTAHGDPSGWSDLTTAEKEAALRLGTQYLDMEYGPHWRGYRADEDQALDWPRYDVEDRDGYEVDSDDVPAALEHACAEAAYRSATETGGLMPDVSEPGTISKYAVKVGPIAKTLEYEGGRSQIKWFRKIDALLHDLVTFGGVERS